MNVLRLSGPGADSQVLLNDPPKLPVTRRLLLCERAVQYRADQATHDETDSVLFICVNAAYTFAHEHLLFFNFFFAAAALSRSIVCLHLCGCASFFLHYNGGVVTRRTPFVMKG